MVTTIRKIISTKYYGCEDGLNDKTYFDKVYKEACELTAYLCTIYNLDPLGWTTCGSTRCPVIVCHADSCNLGLGSNHGDVLHWFPKFGKDMDDVRADVAAIMKAATPVARKTGDVNNDGKVDSTDAQKVLDHTVGKTKLTGENLKAADVNKDGKVDSSDAREILKAAGETTTTTTTKEMYRIRKTWADAASQKGAFTDLNNAKKACDAAGAGYEVYNSKGQVVYTPKTTTTTTTTPAKTLKEGDTCKLVTGAKFTTGDDVPDWVIKSTLYIREISSDDTVVISTLKVGDITGRVEKKYIQGAVASTATVFTPYVAVITAAKLNVRAGAGSNYAVNTTVRKNEAFTIVAEQNGFGKLKSGAGWIDLRYTKKL